MLKKKGFFSLCKIVLIITYFKLKIIIKYKINNEIAGNVLYT